MAGDQGPGNGAPIRYPAIVTTLGKKYEGNWGNAAHDELKRVQGSIAKPEHFGDLPAARDFASVYSAALHVYEATLRGIKQDLEDAGAALAEAGREMTDRDQVSSAAFQQLMTRWSSDDGFSSSREHDAAEDDHRATEGAEAKVRLEDGSRPDGQGGPQGGSDGSGTDPGMPTGDADTPPSTSMPTDGQTDADG